MGTIGKSVFFVHILHPTKRKHRAVISTAHNSFVDRPGITFDLAEDWDRFLSFLQEAGYTGELACALLMQVAKKQLEVNT